MKKSWKNLFFKDEDDSSYDDTFINKSEKTEKKTSSDDFSFPVNKQAANSPANQPGTNGSAISNPVQTGILTNPFATEILDIYEKGLESINMPGYDFYEFYRSVSVANGLNNEQAYKMAYQMAQVMDKTISSSKLVKDADFYISKINEVYKDYVTQGQQKLKLIDDQKKAEKSQLARDVEISNARIAQLKEEILKLEKDVIEKSSKLNGIDAENQVSESEIREKLSANDQAKSTILNKLNLAKENIIRFIPS
jgi:hypothetical protein